MIDNNFIENSVRPLALGREELSLPQKTMMPPRTLPSSKPLCDAANWPRSMCGKLLNHFFTHIHDYDEDYFRDLLEFLYAQSQAEGHPLTSFENPPRIRDLFQESSWSVLQDFENISNILEGAVQNEVY